MLSATLPLMPSSLRLMESFGGRIVMETGFGAVLERFEKAFGRRITNFILALIGIATTVFCCSVIWKLALGPAVAWLSTFSISIAQFETRVEVAWYAAAVAFGYGLTHLMIVNRPGTAGGHLV